MKPLLRWISCLLLGALIAGVGLYVAPRLTGPPLEPWHSWVPESGYPALEGSARTLAAYLELEARQFDELERFLQALRVPRISRYARNNLLAGRVQAVDWNRTVELPAEQPPRGRVLLLHGMSDSPYSMRSLALHLQARGYHVLALRLPGHGTVPAGLARTGWKEMAAVVRLAVKHLQSTPGEGVPLYLFGYSNGAALALEYALSAETEGNPLPAGLVLISPAIAVTSAARVSWLFMLAGRLPGLGQLEWFSVQPEYDPYKYNSFPVNAGYQVYLLARRVQALLRQHAKTGGMSGFPPVLAIQSVVDDTVSAPAVVELLMSRLESGRDELLLFDVNRDSGILGLFAIHDEKAGETLLRRPAAYAATLVTNRGPDSPRVWALHRQGGDHRIFSRPVAAEWPPEVYSLSHIALPFSPDDPVYGAGSTLGRAELRGESSLLAVPVQQLMRLRYNPFYDYMERRIVGFLEKLEDQPAPAKRR